MVLVLCILSDEALYLFQFKFHENIDDPFKVIEWIKLIISKGIILQKKSSRSYCSYSLHVVRCCFIFVSCLMKISLTVFKL